jgi:hypothetical protein
MPNRPLKAPIRSRNGRNRDQNLLRASNGYLNLPCDLRAVPAVAVGLGYVLRVSTLSAAAALAAGWKLRPYPAQRSDTRQELARVVVNCSIQQINEAAASSSHRSSCIFPDQPRKALNQAKRIGFIDPARRSRWSAWLSSRAARCNISFRAPVN